MNVRMAIIPVLAALGLVVPSSSLAQPAITDVVKRVKPAVVKIVTYDASDKTTAVGSGFFISPNSIVTTYHVIEDANTAKIRTSSGAWINITGILAQNQSKDLVLLAVAKPQHAIKPLKVARSLPQEGERVVVIGSPEGLESSISDGVVSAIRDIPNIGQVIQLTAPMSHGSSGSPVVNLQGEVVGVARAYLSEGQNVNFAVPGISILQLRPGKVVPLRQSVAAGSGSGAESTLGKPFVAGLNAYIDKDYPTAETYFRQAINDSPRHYLAWGYLGMTYLQQDKWDQAEAALQMSISINPRWATAYVALGICQLHDETYYTAIDTLKKAIMLEPKNALAHFLLGGAYYFADDTAAALEEYNILKTLNPEMAKGLFDLIYK